MRLNTKYARKLFGWMLVLLAVYAVTMIIVQQNYEKQSRFETLTSRLNAYNEIIEQAYSNGHYGDILSWLPSDLRVTIIADSGEVLEDTDAENISNMESHSTRPELQEARFHPYGTNIRTSQTLDREMVYYARYFQGYYVRTALPLDSVLRSKLKATNYYIYASLFFFLLITIVSYFFISRYDKMINKLRLLGDKIAAGESVEEISFPSDEMDGISKRLVQIMDQKEEARREIESARERLIQHFKLSNIGIALYDSEGNTEFANTHFIQYANMLATKPMTDAKELINEPLLIPIKHFIEDQSFQRSTSITITHSNKIFDIKALKSGGGSYEITIEDVTQQEKNRILKQEMTSNITHEIRTPLTSIRGYLETLNYIELSDEKRKEFTEKAYSQSLRLSEMMDDISLLTKLDEESRPFEFDTVRLHQLVEEVRVTYLTQLAEKDIKFINKLIPSLEIKGNQSLLYSIFQNLVENSLRYAGNGIDIVINCYHQDESHLFFSYYDTGKGVSENQLNRLFERFYRVDEGRTRATGGTGLGLSIVKNAILVHGGHVQARLHPSGGLEILFNLHK